MIRRPFARFGVLVTVAVLSTAAVTACTRSTPKTPPEQVAAQAYLTALGAGDTSAAAGATDNVSAATTTIKASLAGLGNGATGLTGRLTVTGLTNRTASAATADYTADWTLPGVTGHWTYQASLPLVKQNNAWLVQWSTADVHPQLVTGSHLAIKRTQPTRAALLDDAGRPLFTPTAVVNVGIDPGKVGNLTSVATSLAAALSSYGVTAASIVASVKGVPSGQFVPVITLRKTAYEAVKAQIYSLPGVEFPTATELLTPTSGFGQPLLGRVGQATKEIIDASKGTIVAGDEVGTSGLQEALNSTLAGTPAISVVAEDDTTSAIGADLGDVQAAKPGTPVTLTLDRAAQTAADAALASVNLPAAVVALQPSTGKILAVANSAAATDDIALNGEYPPGSTFKIVTYSAQYTVNPAQNPASTVDCPATTVVNGQTFENENKFFHGMIPMSAAFAYSCNTSAIELALTQPNSAIPNAAKALGLGAQWNLGVDSFSGSLPAPTSPNERAADAIGQGKVLVSPLLMASIAGASVTGTPVAPSLMADHPGTKGSAIAAAVTASMNVLERATVAQAGATANSISDLPGVIKGKTGTAEFGTDVPPKTHSWFAGSRGDLAFAVFVYGGDSGGVPALPIVRSFLTAYPGT